MEALGIVLLIGSIIGFFYGVFRKAGKRARWVIPSVILFFVAPNLIPDFQQSMREASKPKPVTEAPTKKPVQTESPTSPDNNHRVSESDEQLFLAICRGLIKDQLAIPESASFTDGFGPGSFIGQENIWTWYGVVKAKNIYGTSMEAPFQCVHYPQPRITKLGYFDADVSLLKVTR